MKLTDLYSPKDHEYMIDRYTKMLTGEVFTSLPDEAIAKKMEWHVAEYLRKTGQLPE